MASYLYLSCGYILSLLPLLLVCSTRGDGFLSVSQVVESSQVLSHYANHSSFIGHWQLFPYARFTCECLITGWRFVATEVVRTETMDSELSQLEFQIWHNTSISFLLSRVANIPISISNISRVSPANSMGMSLMEITLNEPIQVEEDDIFGIFQPKSKSSEIILQYQSGLAPLNFLRPTNTPNGLFSMRGLIVDYDYPLVAVQHECDADCINGFPSSDGLQQFLHTNTNTSLINHPGVNRVLPALNFTCNTSITRIVIGAKRVFGTSWPQVEVWQESDSVFLPIDTIVLTDAAPTSNPGVYEYALPVPLSISANEVVSLYEPADSSLEVYSELESGMRPPSVYVEGVMESEEGQVFSDDHRPLLHIETADGGCTDGFISHDDLVRKSLKLALSTDYNMLYVVPDVSFPKNGNVTKFIFSGHYLESVGSNTRNFYPEIQVWRRNSTTSQRIEDSTFVKVTSIGYNVQPAFTGYVNVYEYELSPPIAVKEGDVLGYYQPPSSDSLMGLVAVEDRLGPEAYYLFGYNPDQIELSSPTVGKLYRTPLISFEIEYESEPMEEGDHQDGGDDILIIGAAAGGVVVAALLVAVLVVAVFIMVRMRRGKSDKQDRDGNENICSSAYDDANSGPAMYDSPFQMMPPGNHHTPSSPTGSHLYYTAPGSPYEQPRPSRSNTLAASVNQQQHSLNQEEEEEKRVELAALLRGKMKCSSDRAPESLEIGVLSSERGDRTNGGGVKIYEEGVYHEPIEVFKLPKKAGGWGIYVPTEEQRTSIYYSSPSEMLAGSVGYGDQCSLNPTSSSASGGAQVFFQEDKTYWAPASNTRGLYKQLSSKKYRELLKQDISVTNHLGSGQFGTVSQGVWSSPRGPVDIAVKTLKPGSTEHDKVKFLQEAAINGQFRHPNVVKLIGVVTIEQPVMIVLELMSNGDLRNHLVKLRPSSSSSPVGSDLAQRLLRFCRDVASGMAYLAGKSFVHRDLAARNILMSEDLTCKISDFGMSRGLREGTYYMSKGGKIPIKWTAPEAIHFNKYSTASDVWSYGMVMYEIWSLGQKPFSDFTNTQTVGLLERSFCLPPPPGTPREVYSIMVQCWHPNKSSRPSFPALCGLLSLPDSQLLHWTTEETAGVGTEAIMIGAPLKTAHKLHMHLQNTYSIRE